MSTTPKTKRASTSKRAAEKPSGGSEPKQAKIAQTPKPNAPIQKTVTSLPATAFPSSIQTTPQISKETYSTACSWAQEEYQKVQGINLPEIATKSSAGTPGRGLEGKVTAKEIDVVQNLIEKCLQLYMNDSEVKTALKTQAGVAPEFTSLVWNKLSELHSEFFRAYNIRLRIKEQITAFNYLISQQAIMMQKSGCFQKKNPPTSGNPFLSKTPISVPSLSKPGSNLNLQPASTESQSLFFQQTSLLEKSPSATPIQTTPTTPKTAPKPKQATKSKETKSKAKSDEATPSPLSQPIPITLPHFAANAHGPSATNLSSSPSNEYDTNAFLDM